MFIKNKNKSPFLHSKQPISLESVYPTCSFAIMMLFFMEHILAMKEDWEKFNISLKQTSM